MSDIDRVRNWVYRAGWLGIGAGLFHMGVALYLIYTHLVDQNIAKLVQDCVIFLGAWALVCIGLSMVIRIRDIRKAQQK